ncbi:MAG: response regulator [Spirochaetales bacterium]|nr:response regulator [Spirochaetales bacterium]
MEKKIKILIVEDDPVQRLLIEKILAKTAEWLDFIMESTLANAQASLYQNEFDLIISDYILPDGKGTELINSEKYPLIVMTSQGSQQIAAEIMKSGAHDYLVKSQELFNEFPHIIERTMREWGLQDQTRSMRDALERSEGICSSLFSQFPEALLVTDTSLVVTMANDRVLDMLKPGEWKNKNISAFLQLPNGFPGKLKKGVNTATDIKISSMNLSVSVQGFAVNKAEDVSHYLFIVRKQA